MNTLEIDLSNGQFKHDADFFTKMDPYVKFIVESTTEKVQLRSKTAKNAGKHPVFNERLMAQSNGQFTTLICECFDDDIGRDKLLGIGSTSLAFLQPGQQFPMNIEVLDRHGKPTGTIQLRLALRGQFQQQPMYGQPMMAPQPVMAGGNGYPGSYAPPMQPAGFQQPLYGMPPAGYAQPQYGMPPNGYPGGYPAGQYQMPPGGMPPFGGYPGQARY